MNFSVSVIKEEDVRCGDSSVSGSEFSGWSLTTEQNEIKKEEIVMELDDEKPLSSEHNELSVKIEPSENSEEKVKEEDCIDYSHLLPQEPIENGQRIVPIVYPDNVLVKKEEPKIIVVAPDPVDYEHNNTVMREKTTDGKNTGNKPYSCFVCDQAFTQGNTLKTHLEVHELHNRSHGSAGCEACDLKASQREVLPSLDASLSLNEFNDFSPTTEENCIKTREQMDTDEHDEKPERIDSLSHSDQIFIEGKSLDLQSDGMIPGKSHSCTECHKSFSRSDVLKRHTMIHTGEKPYSCSMCTKSYRKSSSLKIHMRTHTGEKPYKCSHCVKSFAVYFTLQTHMRSHSGEKPYSCSICEKAFVRSTYLKDHMRTHTGDKPYTCSICAKSFVQSRSLKYHMRTHDGKSYSCSICTKSFSQPIALTYHMVSHTTASSEACDSKKSQSEVVSEKTSVFSADEKSLDSQSDVKKTDKSYSCTQCPKSFTQSGALGRHMRTHSGDKLYSCNICEKTFLLKQHLKGHIRTHTGDKPYSCSICPKAFAHSSSLKCHMRTHTGEKPYSCSICTESFCQSSQLKIHMVRKHLSNNL